MNPNVDAIRASTLRYGFLRPMRTVTVLFLMIATVMPQNGGSLEYDVKGAFLFNFSKFVEWPEGAFTNGRAPLKICIFGSDPFGVGFERLVQNEAASGRDRIVERPQTLEQLRTCHIAFISVSEEPRLTAVLDGLRGAPVLTVGESPDFLDAGGIINFAIERNRVRFDVNVA